MPLDIVVRTATSEPVEDGSTLEVSSGGFYLTALAKLPRIIRNQDARVRLELVPADLGADISHLPDRIGIRILRQSGVVWDSVTLPLEMAALSRELVNWRPRDPDFEHTAANIIVFGPVASGKSSLINSMCSLWKQASEQVALVLPGKHPVTSATKYIKEHRGFAFLDTQGAEEQNYLNFEFPFLLYGVLPFEYKVTWGITDISAVVDENEQTANARQIHSCIFVVTQSSRHLHRSDLMVLKMRQFLHEARDAGLSPLLAVTHMDEIPRSEGQAVRESLAGLFSICPADVFLVNNAPDPTTYGVKPGFAHEKVIYQLIMAALNKAEDFMKIVKEGEILAAEEALRREHDGVVFTPLSAETTMLMMIESETKQLMEPREPEAPRQREIEREILLPNEPENRKQEKWRQVEEEGAVHKDDDFGDGLPGPLVIGVGVAVALVFAVAVSYFHPGRLF